MQFDKIFELVGVILPILSSLASMFNHKARAKQAAGECLTPNVARLGAVLNVGALNFDKAIQMAKAVKAALPEQDEQAAKQGE